MTKTSTVSGKESFKHKNKPAKEEGPWTHIFY